MVISPKGIALTPRERDVLNLIANGLSDSEIAEALVLTVGTVKWYNRQIYNKLGVSNRTLALVQAQQLGLLKSQPAQPQSVQTSPVKNNLPAQLTPFIGRSTELTALHDIAETNRLITLTGSPGTGKTRLSLQLAAEILYRFTDGVFFVSLAPVPQAVLVVNTVAQTLEIIEAGKQSVLDALKQFLSSKHILLILDNFEHILAAAPLVSELLSAAPHLTIFVTSREVLHLYGEHEYVVPPLQLPDLRSSPTLSAIQQCESVTLFVQRAQAVRSEFTLKAKNAATVAAICIHLDGLPLAIELAAARTKLYAPETLLVRLGSRLEVLTDGPRDFPARQRTLRDTLSWSYDLLTADEQILFSRLGVFAGGCTLEAAQAICGNQLAIDVVSGIESLLDKSLLRRETSLHDEPRFVMLETMREFAIEKCVERGEMPSIREHHAHFYLAEAKTAAHFRREDEAYWLERLETRHDNLRAALTWSLETDKTGETSFRLISHLTHFWKVKGYFSEGRGWLKQALALGSDRVRTAARADSLAGIARIAYFQSDYSTAQTLYTQAVTINRELGNEFSMADNLIDLGTVAIETGEYESAQIYFQQGYVIMKALNHTVGITYAVSELGFGAIRVGDYDGAEKWFEEGLSNYRTINDQYGIGLALSGLGEAALRKGELDKATVLLEESLNIRREIHQKWGIAASLGSLGWVAMLQGEDERATQILSESLDLRIEMNDVGGTAWCLEKLAEMAYRRGESRRTVIVFSAAAALRKSVASVIEPADQQHYDKIVSQIRAALGEDTFQNLWSEGENMNTEKVIAFALG